MLIASNSIIYETRIRKIVRSLHTRYGVTVLGWNRDGVSREKIINYFTQVKLFNLRAPFGTPQLIVYLPFFWTWVLFKLFVCKPKVVHACDLDALIPCYIYKLVFRKTKLIFDVFDRYSGYIPIRFIARLVNSFEEFLSIKADVLITVSERVLSTFKRRPENCVVIMNYSEDRQGLKERIEDNVLTLVYTGIISKNLGLEKITDIIKDLNNVELVVAGRVMDRNLMAQIQRISNFKYKGILEHSDALDLEASSDVMVVLYNPEYPAVQLSSPNKVFEAMMCGLPLITNMESELVNNDEDRCGIIVDYNDANQIKDAIISLTDNPDLRKKLGSNGRKMFLEKYNWQKMEGKLYNIYEHLLDRER